MKPNSPFNKTKGGQGQKKFKGPKKSLDSSKSPGNSQKSPKGEKRFQQSDKTSNAQQAQTKKPINGKPLGQRSGNVKKSLDSSKSPGKFQKSPKGEKRFQQSDKTSNAQQAQTKKPINGKPLGQRSGNVSKSKKRKSQISNDVPTKRVKVLPAVRQSDEAPRKKSLWTNRERVLLLASRGVSYLGRHLMKDLIKMMPHTRTDTKLDTKQNFSIINEIAEIKNASKVIFFEARKKADLYMWIACTPNGPSAKFLVENLHTTSEMKLTGNCMRGSRPMLSFDSSMDTSPHWAVLKEVMTQVFGTPNHHPLSQPFIDKVFTFGLLDNRLWFRNYQIADENGTLAEVGPRFSLNLIKLFSGSFGGPVLYENPKYVSPNNVRRMLLLSKKDKYVNKVHSQIKNENRIKAKAFAVDETDDVFQIDD